MEQILRYQIVNGASSCAFINKEDKNDFYFQKLRSWIDMRINHELIKCVFHNNVLSIDGDSSFVTVYSYGYENPRPFVPYVSVYSGVESNVQFSKYLV